MVKISPRGRKETFKGISRCRKDTSDSKYQPTLQKGDMRQSKFAILVKGDSQDQPTSRKETVKISPLVERKQSRLALDVGRRLRITTQPTWQKGNSQDLSHVVEKRLSRLSDMVVRRQSKLALYVLERRHETVKIGQRGRRETVKIGSINRRKTVKRLKTKHRCQKGDKQNAQIQQRQFEHVCFKTESTKGNSQDQH